MTTTTISLLIMAYSKLQSPFLCCPEHAHARAVFTMFSNIKREGGLEIT